MLTAEIIRFLLSFSSWERGLSSFIDLVMRWLILADHALLIKYFNSDLGKVEMLMSRGSASFWKAVLDEWSEPKRVHELVLWTMNLMIERGFGTTKEDHYHFELSNFDGPILDERSLSQRLAAGPPSEAVDCLSNALIGWAWHIDKSNLETHALQTGRYKKNWTPKDLVAYVFLNLHVHVNEGLLQKDFTPEFLEQWH